jgi:diguanylate cyclase (GGDEF)-like protein/PAS domain S-box-containing protein
VTTGDSNSKRPVGTPADAVLRFEPHDSADRLQDLFEDFQDGYYEVDLRGNFLTVNQALCDMHRTPREELIGRNNRAYTQPHVAQQMYQIFNQVYRTGKPVNVFNYWVIRGDGTTGVRETSVHLMRDANGEPCGFRGITRDVTDRERNEAYEQTRNRALESLARNAPLDQTLTEVLAGLHVQMPESSLAFIVGDEVDAELQVAAGVGWALEYLESLPNLKPEEAGPLFSRAIESLTAVHVKDFGAVGIRDPNVEAALRAGFHSAIAQPIVANEGHFLGLLLVLWHKRGGANEQEQKWLKSAVATAEIAITHHRLMSRLAYLSQHDPLTGLLNRRSLMELGAQAMALAKRHGWTPGMLFLDLDGFKPVNDQLGHQAGDRLLVAIAERLRGTVRDSDCLARMGGDEFAILTPELTVEGAERFAKRIAAAFEQPFGLDCGEAAPIRVGVSIGVARAGGSDDRLETLIVRSDEAMYQAKARGGGYVMAPAPG